MSTATITDQFVNGARACQAAGVTRYLLLRAVALGRVRVRLEPGVAPLYAIEDCRRLAAERRGNTVTTGGPTNGGNPAA